MTWALKHDIPGRFREARVAQEKEDTIMSLETPLPFVEKLEIPALKLRYFAFNCFEIKLPDGKTLVIDPCLKKEGKFSCGYGPCQAW